MTDFLRQVHLLDIERIPHDFYRAEKFVGHTDQDDAPEVSVDPGQAVHLLQGLIGLH